MTSAPAVAASSLSSLRESWRSQEVRDLNSKPTRKTRSVRCVAVSMSAFNLLLFRKTAYHNSRRKGRGKAGALLIRLCFMAILWHRMDLPFRPAGFELVEYEFQSDRSHLRPGSGIGQGWHACGARPRSELVCAISEQSLWRRLL